MSIAMDEYGNPFILLREQESKKRLKGMEAHRANILAARSVASTIRSSLGPRGMDKIIMSPDGDVTVTNDGATILSKMEVTHQCAKLLVDLSNCQDDEVGDGTTGVVVIAGALLERAAKLLEKGINPLQIADGFEAACEIAQKKLDSIAVHLDVPDRASLLKAALTSLGSKVVSSCQQKFAELAVDAVLCVADMTRRDVDFELIKVEGKPGGRMDDSELINGIVLDKELSHPQMEKVTKDAKIAILTCPFEPPKPKTKHKLNIQTVEDYENLRAAEQAYFVSMVDKVKSCGANFVICQWGFDDEANHLLYLNGLPSVRWVGGVEIELVAIATGGRIVARFDDLSPDKLGSAVQIEELSVGTEKDQMVVIKGCGSSKAVSVIIRGGNQMIVDEAKRCFHDAICCVRNLIKSPAVLPGGGASEIAISLAVEVEAEKCQSVLQYSMVEFATALLSIPEALAENSGMNSIETVASVKACQVSKNSANYGVDCLKECVSDMLEAHVWESLLSKKSQLALATQVVRMILKIDDVILPSELN